MGTKKLSDAQAGFAGGLNTVSDPSFLRPDQARQMANVRLTNVGAAFKRLGTMLAKDIAFTGNDTTNSVAGGIYWPLQSKSYIVTGASASTAMALWSATYPSGPSQATLTEIGACPQYRPVIFTDGTTESLYLAGDTATAVAKYDGSSITALGASTAKVAGLCVFNDRLWGWKSNSLYYSNLASAVGSTGGDSLGNAAASGGQIVIRTFGMSTIVFAAPVGSSLLILHQKGISRLTGFGQDDIDVAPQALSADVGMGRATAWGACLYDNVIYFITDRGMYQATESSVTPLSTPDQPDPIFALLQAGTTDPSQCWVTYNRAYNEVWCVLKGIGVYVYNTILRAWSGPFTGSYALAAFRAIWEVYDSLGTLPVGTPYGNSHLWMLTNVSPGALIEECDKTGVYKDAVLKAGTGGTAVTATIQLHRMFATDRSFSKAWRWVRIMASLSDTATPPVLTYSAINGGTSTQTLAVTASAQNIYSVGVGGTGPYLDVTITDAGVSLSQYASIGVEGFLLGER